MHFPDSLTVIWLPAFTPGRRVLLTITELVRGPGRNMAGQAVGRVVPPPEG